MRQVMSISLPVQFVKDVKQRAKRRGYENMSKYIFHLLEADAVEPISEQELLRLLKQAKKEHKEGKTIKANSVMDLLKK